MPCKAFKDLDNCSIVYFVDIAKVSMTYYYVKDVSVKDISDVWSHNQLQVDYTVTVENEDVQLTMYDGEKFTDDYSLTNKSIIICTDLRIAETIIRILKLRNDIQWKSFKNVFGDASGCKLPTDEIRY